MARGKRLISKTEVDGWEAKLRKASTRALDAQVASMNLTLRANGVHGSLVAAGKSPVKNKTKRNAHAAAIGAIAVPFLWSQANWNKNVEQYLEPVAEDVAKAAIVAAAAGTAAISAWGLATIGQTIVNRVTTLAQGVGQSIGTRVDAAGTADDDIVTGVSTVLSTAPDILGDVIGALSQYAANMASQSTAESVTSYSAPTYLSASKTWNTMEDDAVRPDHADADGQEVAINETFTVGGEDLTGPGDDSGSYENTINCRCWTTYDGLVPEGYEPDAYGDNNPNP